MSCLPRSMTVSGPAKHTFAEKVLLPTRQGFGGHNEAKPHGPSRMADKA
jgi:hypothetical protein